MNGLIARSKFPPAPRIARALVILLCSALSVSLVGAVSTRLEPPRPVKAPPREEPVLAAPLGLTQQSLSVPPAALPSVPAVPAPAPTAQDLLKDARMIVASISSQVDRMLVTPALPPAPKYTVKWMEVTAYCPCTKCCGPRAQGITASGRHVTFNNSKFVAADRAVPFNTKLVIPGYNGGHPVPVLDRGGAIKGDKLDVYFPTHHEARQWGRKRIPVSVLN